MLRERVQQLTDGRVPFVHALVVRAQVPTSARPGDDAIVLADGSIEGFVGGQCATGAVRVAALEALRGGQARLLRVLPDDSAGFPEAPGADVVINPCLSGGALEIFLEPVLPSPLVQVVGDSPVAQAVSRLTEFLGYAPAGEGVPDAVVIASHGRDEHATIRAALDAGAGYVALVASPRRGEAVLAELGLTAAERQRVSTPAGFDIGARTAPEIAVSILAELVRSLRTPKSPVPPASPVAGTVTDPVCGMPVVPAPGVPHLTVNGSDVWFCGAGCRDHYAAGV